MMEKEKVLRVVNEYESLRKKAKEIVIEHLTIKNGKLPFNFDDEEVIIGKDYIRLIYTTGCMGCYDREYYYCPVECLWNDSWKEDLVNTLIEEKRKKDIDKLEAQKQKDAKKIEYEKATLRDLREKYSDI